MPAEEQSESSITQTSPAGPLVLAQQINKWYDEYHCLRDVDLVVHRGECVAICGPSGSGKSTLIRCIAGLECFHAGRLRVNGTEFQPDADNNFARLRGVIMVFQSFNLFPHLTVLENVTLGPIDVLGVSKRQARDDASQQLNRMQMAPFADRYPWQLSGGQQQRVAIARALAMKPVLMLFDEPTASLDPELKKGVREIMAELARDGMTMLVVTHEHELAQSIADRIVHLESGRPVEQGRTELPR